MITKRTGRVSAVVMGLISGIIIFIFALIISFAAFLGGSFGLFGGYFYGATVLAAICVFVVGLLNMIGGCIVRRSRITGGVFMIITAIPIIMISLSAFWLMWFITILGLMSLTAAILAFVPYSDSYLALYAQRKQQQFAAQHRYQQPYGQQSPQYQRQPQYGQQPPQYQQQPQYSQQPSQYQQQPQYGQQPPQYRQQPQYGQQPPQYQQQPQYQHPQYGQQPQAPQQAAPQQQDDKPAE